MIVLPALAATEPELSEEELEAVAGGNESRNCSLCTVGQNDV